MRNGSLISYFEKKVNETLPGHMNHVPTEMVIDCFGDVDSGRKWFSEKNCVATPDLAWNGLITFMKNRSGN